MRSRFVLNNFVLPKNTRKGRKYTMMKKCSCKKGKCSCKKMEAPKKDMKKKESKKEKKFEKVMHEYGEGKLHSGSKHGPVVSNPKQALAISFSESKKVSKKKKKK